MSLQNGLGWSRRSTGVRSRFQTALTGSLAPMLLGVLFALIAAPALRAQTAHAGGVLFSSGFDPRGSSATTISTPLNFPVTPVGSTSDSLLVLFTFDSAGSLAATPYVVLTQGAQGLDYQAPSTQDSRACVAGRTYQKDQNCTVNVTFGPTRPFQRIGAVQLMGASGTPIATFNLRGNGTGPIVTFASTSTAIPVGSGFKLPGGVAVDGSGNVFVADSGNGAVKQIVAVNGVVSSTSTVNTLVSGSPSAVAVDGSGNIFFTDIAGAVKQIVAANGLVSSTSTVITVASGLNSPAALAVDGRGNVFVADSGNNAVKEIVAISGIVSSDSPVNTVGSGFSYPDGVSVDSNGDVFVADTGHYVLKEIVAVNGAVTSNSVVNTVASGFNSPGNIAVDGSGNVFVADIGNSALKEVVAVNGMVSPSSPVLTIGSFNQPYGVAVDANGNVFVADQIAVQEIDRADPPAFPFASTPVGSTSSDSPQSLTVQNSGNAPLNAVPPGISVSMNFAQVAGSGTPADCTSVFVLNPNDTCTLSLSFTPQSVGAISGTAVLTDNALNATPSATQVIHLSGTGIAITPVIMFNISNQTYSTNPFQVTATSTSTAPFMYSLVSGPATVATSGMVTATGTGTVVVQATQPADGNYTAGSQQASFTISRASSTTTLTGSLNQSPSNTATLTATVRPQISGTPTGTVTFYNGSTPLKTVSLMNGTAMSTTGAYTGSQTFTAIYNGDGNFTASAPSSPVTFTFTVPPTITFTTAVSYAYGQSFQASATSNSTGAFMYSVVSGPATVTAGGFVTITGEGTVVLQASEAAAAGYTAASKQTSFTAVQASSVAKLTTTTVKSGYGSTASLKSVVSPQYTGTPTGSVTFYDGSAKLATVSLSNGTAMYTTQQLVGAQHSFSAVYAGDGNFTASTSNTAPLTIPFTAVSLQLPSTQFIYPLSPIFTIKVAVSGNIPPTGTVTLYDGATAIGTYTLFGLLQGNLIGLVLPPLKPGTHFLLAVYSGDANYASGQSATVMVTVAAGLASLF